MGGVVFSSLIRNDCWLLGFVIDLLDLDNLRLFDAKGKLKENRNSK
jgi:hypothetical protein